MRKLTVEEVKARELDILRSVRDFCRERGLTCYIAYGTLIGAVRHQGFIPWDDDVDVIMFREDYDVFMREFNIGRRDALRAKCPENDRDYYHNMGKVIDSSTRLEENNHLGDEMGVYIDVFAFDYLPEDAAERAKVRARLQHLRNYYRRINEEPEEQKNPVKRFALLATKLALRLLPGGLIARKMNEAAANASGGKKTSICGELTSYSCGDRSIFETAWFDGTVELPFEGELFPAPKEYDKILRFFYGDYMALPPEEKRHLEHGFTAYALEAEEMK